MARGRPAGSKNKKSGGGKGGKSGKSEAMTGAKENAVEMRKVSDPQLLLEQPIETEPGDFKKRLERLLSDYVIYTRHQGYYREKIKEAKDINPLLAEALKLAVKYTGKDGTLNVDAIIAKVKVQGFVMAQYNSTIQLSMHDTLLGNENDLASKRGHQNGKAGTAMDNPYPENSDLANLYSDAYLRGQAGMPLLQGAQVQDDQESQDDDLAPADHNTRNGMDAEENASA